MSGVDPQGLAESMAGPFHVGPFQKPGKFTSPVQPCEAMSRTAMSMHAQVFPYLSQRGGKSACNLKARLVPSGNVSRNEVTAAG